MGRGPDCSLLLTYVHDVVNVAQDWLNEETADDYKPDDRMVPVELVEGIASQRYFSFRIAKNGHSVHGHTHLVLWRNADIHA